MITTIKNNETKYLNDIEDWICLSCDHFTTINQDYCANGSVQLTAHFVYQNFVKSAHFGHIVLLSYFYQFRSNRQIYRDNPKKMGKESKVQLAFQWKHCFCSVFLSVQCYPYLLKIRPPITPAGIPIPRSKGITFFQKDAVSCNESAASLMSNALFAGVFTSGCVFGSALIISRFGSGIALITIDPTSAIRITPNALRIIAEV